LELALANEASALLSRHWRNGSTLEALPSQLRPTTRADGYLIQSQLEKLSSQPLFGWKIAATSHAGQQHIAVDGPLAGRLLSEMVHPEGATIALGANRMRVAEAEFAFRMNCDLPPRAARYEIDEVLDAVASLHPAIEVPDSRFDNFTVVGAPQLIADNACAHQFVLGPEAPAAWRSIDLASHRVVGEVGTRLSREGSGANVLGDPRLALVWLVNELSQHGLTLGANQIVTTGTCLVPLEIFPGDRVTVHFGALGRIGVQFA
jgi:2-keto-4-pentenoate hydratase